MRKKVCSKCHILKALRAFNACAQSSDGKRWQCRQCDSKDKKRHYLAHQEEAIAYSAAYRASHPGQASLASAAWRAQHPTQVKTYSARYYAENKDTILLKHAQWYATHLPHVRAYSARYYVTHRDILIAKARAWVQAHPERRQAYQAAYYAENKAAISTVNALWRTKNSARIRRRERRYRQTHLDMIRVKNARRRAKKTALPDTWTDTQRQFMQAYWHHACAICGNEEGLYWTLAYDHFIPLAAPTCPGTTAGNMLPLCHAKRSAPLGTSCCNNAKSSKDPQTWLVERCGTRKAPAMARKIAAYFALAAVQP